MRAVCVLVAVLACCGAARAQQSEPEVSPDRPDFSDGTDVVALGHVQIEGGMTVSRSGDERDVSVGEVFVRVPLSTRVEMRVGIPSFLAAREGEEEWATGADDLFVETKLVLVPGERAALAVLLNASLPTGSRDVAEHRFQPGATLAADLTLSDKVGLSLNVGDDDATNDGRRFNQAFVSGSFDFELSKKADAFAEVYALERTEPHGHAQRYADTGLSYHITSRTVVDARVGAGLGNGTGGPDYFFGFGVTRLF
jgi:hypothetical protein